MVDYEDLLSHVEKEYLDDAVKWALTLDWHESDGSEIDDHEHCDICTRPMKPDGSIGIYKSGRIHIKGRAFICEACYRKFIEKRDLTVRKQTCLILSQI
ncbi:MAG: hypothetical protein GY839_13470 [candidate division Zixibacteria bacterium]|nr:hypothetical protein [candidate division Zixibacteria bacterium]